ncbi:MAG: VWA domain-containing protein, partial [Anaerolineae bacterium]|nr:VWA domain-containing protein [Anaerolineae bacterium]
MKRNMWLLLAVSAVLGIGLIWAGSGWLNPATADDAVTPPPLDIAVVFDASGSMDFETTCFDCWEPVGSTNPKFDIIANPWPANGTFNPLPDVTTTNVCTQTPQSIVDPSGNKYFVHEAELYSRDVPWQGWQFERRVVGQGFWVIQRPNGRDASGMDSRGAYIRAHPFPVYSQSNVNEYPQLQGAAYNNECFQGPNLSGTCWKSLADTLGEPYPPSTPPYVEYDFTPDWSGNTHVWIRAQGSGGYGWAWNGRSPADNPAGFRNLPAWRKAIFWQIGRADDSSWSDVQGRDFTNLDQSNDYRLPDNNKWRWLKLGSVATTSGVQQTLRLYQGSAGFQVDKIIFTDFAGGDVNTTIDEAGSVRGNASGITTAFKNFLNQNGGHGPPATIGSGTREACNVCNPVFGQTVDPDQCSCKTSSADSTSSLYGAGGAGIGCTQVLSLTNHLNNDLYHDEDPIRSEKEGVKYLADLLDPAIDQLALVAFSNNVFNGTTNGIRQRAELQCLRWAAANDVLGVLKCFDPATNPISFTQVIRSVEIHRINGGTNIPEGLREGLEELGIETPNNTGITSDCAPAINDKRVCDRQGMARRVLILMTDGIPNDDDNCPAADNLWAGTRGQGRRPYNCAIYYAQQAANHNVSLFTIGIGPGFDPDLLAAMATGTDPT